MSDFDTEEFQMLVVVGAGNAISAGDYLAFDFQADHDEMPVLEAQTRIARGAKTEQRVVPVMHANDVLGSKL